MIHCNTDGVLGQTGQLGVWPARGEDLGVAGSDHVSPLPLERTRNDGCAAGLLTATDDPVDELHQVVSQSHGDLPTHTTMLPSRDH